MKISKEISDVFRFEWQVWYFLQRSIRRSPAPPKCLADPSAVEKAIKVLSEAKKPLVIIGKGKDTRNIHAGRNIRFYFSFMFFFCTVDFIYLLQVQLMHKLRSLFRSLLRDASYLFSPHPWGRGWFLMNIPCVLQQPDQGTFNVE